MSILITHIGELTTQDAGHAVLRDAAVVLEGERISWIGPASAAPAADTAYDAGGRAGLPGWVDSHTHLVFAGDRTAEFEARMAGQSYSAGGIAVTTGATRSTSDFDLTRLAMGRVAEAVSQGTTYLETKTGYGLDLENEARSARIASTYSLSTVRRLPGGTPATAAYASTTVARVASRPTFAARPSRASPPLAANRTTSTRAEAAIRARHRRSVCFGIAAASRGAGGRRPSRQPLRPSRRCRPPSRRPAAARRWCAPGGRTRSRW